MADADALLEDAEQLLDARCIEAALARYEAAEAAGAALDRCAAGRWMAAMLRGEFEHAWRESDGIRKRGGADPYRFWNGEDLAGKNVILRCLHGFGDAVQMLRFAAQLASRCAVLVVEVPPRLLELAPFFQSVEHVITWGALAPSVSPAWNVQVEVMELPYLMRITQATLPAKTKYLKLPQTTRDRFAAAMGARRRPRVGLVWAAGEWNPSRSLPLDLLARLLRFNGCEFWNLQGGKERAEWSTIPGSQKQQDAAQCGDGILNLAAVIEQLDLVITVDTLAAHLAGALGKPAWVLLQYAADWRWMVDRADSPWYPSLKLYRQQSLGDWNSAIQEMESDLAQWLQQESRLDFAG